MKLNFEINYEDKKYSSLNDISDKDFKDRMKDVLKKVEPFNDEIKKHEGKLIINANGNPLKVTTAQIGLPNDLYEEIKKAII